MHVGERLCMWGKVVVGSCWGGRVPPTTELKDAQVNPGYVDVHEDANTLRSLLFDHAVY